MGFGGWRRAAAALGLAPLDATAAGAAGAPSRVAHGTPLDCTTTTRRARTGKITYPIPAADSAQIDRANEIILVRWQNAVYAFDLSCPHQNTALRWNATERRFPCPKHHSQYRPDGQFIEGRATRGMDRLAIRREGSSVAVDPDVMYKEDENPAEWKVAVVALA